MGIDPEVAKLIENLSKQLNPDSNDAILEILPSRTDPNPDESLLSFLNNSSKLFERTIFFRPTMSVIVRQFGGEYVSLIRKVGGTDLGITVNLLRTVEKSNPFSGKIKKVNYRITIEQFNLSKTLDYLSKSKKLLFIESKNIFTAECEKWLDWKYIRLLVSLFRNKKDQELKNKIFSQMESLEKDIAWAIKNQLDTFNK